MTKKPKSATALTEEDLTVIRNKAWAQARAEYDQETKPQRVREEFEHYKREVRSGDAHRISNVIFQALSHGNIRADIALREYIAELVRPLQTWERE